MGSGLVPDSALSLALSYQTERERECMCVYVSLDLGAVLALSSSMQLESALQQRCLIEKAGERVRERL